MKRTFFYHYNKPASKAAKRPIMSVHFKNKCYIVDHVNCIVSSHTAHRKRQPFCVMKGKCMVVNISTREDGLTEATIL